MSAQSAAALLALLKHDADGSGLTYRRIQGIVRRAGGPTPSFLCLEGLRPVYIEIVPGFATPTVRLTERGRELAEELPGGVA
jgi:hypothetical protein